MYKIIFWNLYLFHQFIKRNYEIYSKFPSKYEALFSLTTLEAINVLSVFNVLHVNINLKENEILYWLIMICIILFNYFYLTRKSQIEKYLKKTELMNKTFLSLGKNFTIAYVCLTVCFIFISDKF